MPDLDKVNVALEVLSVLYAVYLGIALGFSRLRDAPSPLRRITFWRR